MLGSSFKDLFHDKYELVITGSSVSVHSTYKMATVAKFSRPDLIVNCAAYTNVDGAEDSKNLAKFVNRNGPMNIAIVANMIGASAIHFSTDYVFNGEDGPYNEYAECDPVNYYGRSKLDGENRFIPLIDKGFVVRTSWLFSESHNNFLRTMLRLFNTQEVVTVVDDQFGSPTYTPWLVKTTHDVWKMGTKEPVLHIANKGICSWYEFAKEIYEVGSELGLVERTVNVIPTSTEKALPRRKAIRPKNSVLNTSLVERHVGELMSWKQGVRTCLENIKKEKDNVREQNR